MKLNYDKLHEFLKTDMQDYYDSCSIPLDELYENPSELTINELTDLLDYIYGYTEEQDDYSSTAIFNIIIKYSPNNFGDEIYLLEMKWPTIFDSR